MKTLKKITIIIGFFIIYLLICHFEITLSIITSTIVSIGLKIFDILYSFLYEYLLLMYRGLKL